MTSWIKAELDDKNILTETKVPKINSFIKNMTNLYIENNLFMNMYI